MKRLNQNRTPAWYIVKYSTWVAMLVFIVLYSVQINPKPLGTNRKLLEDDDIRCKSISSFTAGDQCLIAQNECDPDGFFNYYTLHYCWNYHFLTVPALFIVLVFMFYLLASTTEEYFCPTLAVISDKLRLAPDIAGLTLLAFGNGAPDVFSTIAAVKSDALTIAIGELAGAGVFITTIVVGSVALVSHCKVKKLPFLRDIITFLIASVIVLLICNDGKINIWESLLFLIFYALYVIVSIIINHVFKKKKKDTGSITQQDIEKKPLLVNSSINDSTYSVDDSPSVKMIKSRDLRKVYLAKVGVVVPGGHIHHIQHMKPTQEEMEAEVQESVKSLHSAIYLSPWRYKVEEFIHLFKKNSKWVKKKRHQRIAYLITLPIRILLALTVPPAKDKYWNRYLATLYPVLSPIPLLLVTGGLEVWVGVIPLWAIIELVGCVFAVLTWFTTKYEEPPPYKLVYIPVSFVISIVWVYMFANEIVSLLQTLGSIFRISEAILGIFLSWGNSLTDFVADVVVARKGLPGMAVAACYAGPLFNMLMGLGLSLSIKCAHIYPEAYAVDMSFKLHMMFAFLVVSLLAALIVVPITGFVIKKPLGIFLIAVNIIFNVVCFTMEVVDPDIEVPRIFHVVTS